MRIRILVAAGLASVLTASASAMHTAAPLPPSMARPLTPVILDPGHGGNDFGAVVKDLQEKNIALAVALKLRDRIKGDVPVMLTRDDDTFVPLDHRVINAVDWNGAVFVSIHLNKVRNKKTAGATVYSYGPDHRHLRRRFHKHPIPKMPAPPGVDASESEYLAGSMVKAMREDGLRVEEAKSDYYVLKNPAQPSVLVEIGYLSNPDEAARLNDPAYQDKLVAAMAKAIEAYASERSLRAEPEATVTASAALAPARL
ncbi:MAG TPA: N-acetylmuramoyl-L-alanine amidase [Elusimicrobiota bacterium]|nr:N-acetylmuramoyl-L-alanine amidase [Elusimicrobiota bacterium]